MAIIYKKGSELRKEYAEYLKQHRKSPKESNIKHWETKYYYHGQPVNQILTDYRDIQNFYHYVRRGMSIETAILKAKTFREKRNNVN